MADNRNFVQFRTASDIDFGTFDSAQKKTVVNIKNQIAWDQLGFETMFTENDMFGIARQLKFWRAECWNQPQISQSQSRLQQSNLKLIGAFADLRHKFQT